MSCKSLSLIPFLLFSAAAGADNASSSTSSATLGGSCHPTRGAYTYNLDRFLDQDMFEDGSLHGRVPEHAFHPRPKACIPFYTAKAANAIDDFNTAFSGCG
jgi:hypothetical protein